MGKLLRRMVDSDELLAEWDQADAASVESAEREYQRWLDQEYVAVRCDDGAHYAPIDGDRLPVDAAEVILTTAMGGGESNARATGNYRGGVGEKPSLEGRFLPKVAAVCTNDPL